MIFTSEGLDSVWQQEIAVQVEVDVDSSAHVDASGLPICRLPFWTGIGQGGFGVQETVSGCFGFLDQFHSCLDKGVPGFLDVETAEQPSEQARGV